MIPELKLIILFWILVFAIACFIYSAGTLGTPFKDLQGKIALGIGLTILLTIVMLPTIGVIYKCLMS